MQQDCAHARRWYASSVWALFPLKPIQVCRGCLFGAYTASGLYANLARLRLPYPEAVFDIGFFRKNPEPFYTLAHELYPGKFRPTITHSFIRLLAQRNLLHMCFTQNIDTLERRAGVPDEKIIEAHGSFATQRCIECHRPYDDDKMKAKVLAKETPRCERKSCGGLIKPDIVFFGESLPDDFIAAIPKVAQADLLIVMGTSMTVHPFAGLAERTTSACPRVLINLERVGNIGRRPKDTVLLGKCDEVVLELCKALGWEKELMKLWAKTEIKEVGYIVPDEVDETDFNEPEAKVEVKTENLVETITEAIGRQLNIDERDEHSEKATNSPKKVADEAEGVQLEQKDPEGVAKLEAETVPKTEEEKEPKL
ncbi:NAD-dependent protein deacetylase [Mycena indigotica]|uniref:NAD-dependent protein deacetylase n=1 Tax=Mycena indigotica TaxID=2126181 RepID=A0A8H6SFS8_9AGAR|nr:NAD-dependent protein deacetylase [Mycena indigotica]KAF7298738.1 NAD-dependent protein deacetylase [Mycena indigotica]